MDIIIIAAKAKNDVIGFEGKIPWHSKEEFKHFKSTTMGCPMIMGRKTFESIGKPLPGRLSIVISSNSNFNVPEGVVLLNSLEDAVAFCAEKEFEKVFIIGGGTIYKKAFHLANKMIITEMDLEPQGDTYFPQISPKEWVQNQCVEHSEFIVKYYARQ